MKSPFKFLDSYTKEDRGIFFGRDHEIEELYHRVFESKIMLVYGVSGTGKSSLIHCGLANKFQDTDWLPVIVRRGGNIIESMSAAIQAAAITKQSRLISPSDFKKGVRSLYLDYYKPVFFLFDQFEELFIFGTKDERRSFINIIKSISDSDLQCRIIFVMREEYMAAVSEFEKFIPTFFANRVRIEKMSHRNALQAIKGPCEAFSITIEEGFAETLLEKLSPGGEDVELTYLQVFLDKIFRSATEVHVNENDRGNTRFTLQLLEKTGNVSDLLGSFLDEQISLMEDPETAMTVLKAFISGRGTKRPASEQEAEENIRSFGKEIERDKLRLMIQSFVRLRVLRDKDDNERYELRHDALAEKVYEKFSTSEKELLEIRQLIENAYQYYLKRKILLSSEDMVYIADKDSLLNLGPELQAFLVESRQLQKARKRTIKWLIIFSSFAFLILLATIAYTVVNKTNNSGSVILAHESLSQFKSPFDRLCLAGWSYKLSATPAAKEALFESFNDAIRNTGNNKELIDLSKKYYVNFRHVSSPLIFASSSKDNRFIYGYTRDSVFIWRQNGELFSGFSAGETPLLCIKMSDDGLLAGAVNSNSQLIVWDNLGNVRFTRKTGSTTLNHDQIFRFDKKNRLLLISPSNGAELIDDNGKTIQELKSNESRINAVAVSGDLKFIATAGSDSTVNIWYFNSIDKKYDIFNNIKFKADTILSVDFAKNCRYFLTTDNKGYIIVTSVNGKISWEAAGKLETNLGQTTNLGYPFLAEFTNAGNGLTFISTRLKNDSKEIFAGVIYADIYYCIAQFGEVSEFSSANFSPDNKYIAVTLENRNLLLAYKLNTPSGFAFFNNYKLLSFSGQQPFFSADSKYIYSICGDHIESWCIDVESISATAYNLYENL